MSWQRRLEQADKQYIWHPFTQMRNYQEMDPVIIERGEGSYLIDIYGRRYLDGVSSLWVIVHGHRREEIDRAIVEQVGRISHSTLLGLSNPPAIELAKQLVEITPAGLERVFYSDNGSTGCEVALKMAFQYWHLRGEDRKTRFISFTNAYHGDTLGAASVGGIDLFHEAYRPLLFPVLQADAPYCYRCPLGLNWPACGMTCLGRLERILKDHHQEVAALIIEPLVQGAAGMITQPLGFLPAVRELCTRYGVLMIADEVAVGFGRTGTMFACDHEGVKPDVMVLAKGITGGYLPLAATLATEEVYGAFLGEYHEFKTFFHGHTYTGNPLACAAALANLDVFARDETIERLAPKIDLLSRRLEQFKDIAAVGDVRQQGFMTGVELVADRKTKVPFPPQEKVGIGVMLEARTRGVIIRPLGDIIVIMPPLSITEGELEELLGVIHQSIQTVTGGTAR
ncbi:MAG: adenosylmethionine--8-amino-7-oxononanoate transaminase [Deltaproteobacteria bacterium RBG_13_52_11]|nr:MAG: adenosylmethionine--8-amino-7-oxononanoate transaminase [Deltaproteobacteria bacterium RBG_13_52_11]